MPQLINNDKELIRINPKKNTLIEFSTNNGTSWQTRYSGTNNGEFIDLCKNGKEILGATTKGLFYSTNNGSSWQCRYYNQNMGKFETIIYSGPVLLASTTNGLFYSTNNGSSWLRKS